MELELLQCLQSKRVKLEGTQKSLTLCDSMQHMPGGVRRVRTTGYISLPVCRSGGGGGGSCSRLQGKCINSLFLGTSL